MGLTEVLVWLTVAVVAGGFLGLLARQMWVLALVIAVVVLAYAWRELR